jgi:hypothetical protein
MQRILQKVISISRGPPTKRNMGGVLYRTECGGLCINPGYVVFSEDRVYFNACPTCWKGIIEPLSFRFTIPELMSFERASQGKYYTCPICWAAPKKVCSWAHISICATCCLELDSSVKNLHRKMLLIGEFILPRELCAIIRGLLTTLA